MSLLDLGTAAAAAASLIWLTPVTRHILSAQLGSVFAQVTAGYIAVPAACGFIAAALLRHRHFSQLAFLVASSTSLIPLLILPTSKAIGYRLQNSAAVDLLQSASLLCRVVSAPVALMLAAVLQVSAWQFFKAALQTVKSRAAMQAACLLLAAALTTLSAFLPTPYYPVHSVTHLTALVWGITFRPAASASKALSALHNCILVLIAASFVTIVWSASPAHSNSVALGDYTLLWTHECSSGGWLSIVEGHNRDASFRVMKLDHSVLGGIYTAPEEYAGQSVFTTFYLQEALRLTDRPATAARPRALMIGLGVGTSAKALQQHGIEVDVVELLPEIVWAAEKFFSYSPGGGRVLVADAAAAIAEKAGLSRPPQYSFIIHDVFSGGSLPRALFTVHFFRQLRLIMQPNGVLAVNYWGLLDDNLLSLALLLEQCFGHVRSFSAEPDGGEARNFVLFASGGSLSFRRPVLEDYLGDALRATVLRNLPKLEVDLGLAGTQADPSDFRMDDKAQTLYSLQHWSAMRSAFGPVFWTRTF